MSGLVSTQGLKCYFSLLEKRSSNNPVLLPHKCECKCIAQWFVYFQRHSNPCCQSRALPALCFICGEQSGSGWALTSGVCNSTCEKQPGLTWAHLPKQKKRSCPPSSPLPFVCCLCLVSSNYWPQTILCYHFPCSCLTSVTVSQWDQPQNPCLQACCWVNWTILSLP